MNFAVSMLTMQIIMSIKFEVRNLLILHDNLTTTLSASIS